MKVDVTVSCRNLLKSGACNKGYNTWTKDKGYRCRVIRCGSAGCTEAELVEIPETIRPIKEK